MSPSHMFTTLPSDRSPLAQSPSRKLLDRLVRRAIAEGPHGCNARSDSARFRRRHLLDAVARGEPVRLCYETQPGAFIIRRPDHERKLLRELTSDDVKRVSVAAWDIGEWALHDWGLFPEPGKRYKFGHIGDPAFLSPVPLEGTPKLYKVRGFDSERQP